mgnify:CR=1 FL=1
MTLGGRVDAEDIGGNLTWTNTQTVFAGADGKPLGTLTIDQHGKYTYTLTENGSKLVQSMNEGDTMTETFEVQVTIDGSDKIVKKDITITIKAPTTGPNWNCSAAMITASLFPRVRRPTETRRPTPQSP